LCRQSIRLRGWDSKRALPAKYQIKPLQLVAFRNKAKELGYESIATAALAAWEWLQRAEHLFGAFEVKHYRPPERPDSVHVVHPKTGEEAWWPLFDAAGRPLFPELMAELDAIKVAAIAGHMFRRNHKHRRGAVPLPWITQRGELDYVRATVKKSCVRLNSETNCPLVHSAMAASRKEQMPI
jgi:hypothetical protein